MAKTFIDLVSQVKNTLPIITGGTGSTNRTLGDSNANTLSIDWQNRLLKNSSGQNTLDWTNYRLLNNLGITTVDWLNRQLMDNTNVISLDWAGRNIVDSAGTTSISYGTPGVVTIANAVRVKYSASQTFAPVTDDNALVTKSYTDAVASGLTPHTSVSAIAASNVALTGAQTIDGVALVATNRVLLIGQTNPIENGVWVVAAGAWARGADLPAGSSAVGAYFFAAGGTGVYEDTGWVCSTAAGSDLVGTNGIAFVQFSSAGVITAGNGISKTVNALSVNGGAIVASGSGLAVDGTNAWQIRIPLTGKGYLLSASAADTAALLAPGSDGQVLVANSAAASGLQWVTPPAAISTSAREVPAGLVTSNYFLLANVPVSGKEEIYVNGILQDNAGGITLTTPFTEPATFTSGSTGLGTFTNAVAAGYVAGQIIKPSSSSDALAVIASVTTNAVTLTAVYAGATQAPGAVNLVVPNDDYAIYGKTFAFLTAPVSNDKVRASYIY